MYEHENVPEATCEGRWLREKKGFEPHAVSVRFIGGIGGGLRFQDICGGYFPCREKGVTWTGPIPEPEAKLRVSDEEPELIEPPETITLAPGDSVTIEVKGGARNLVVKAKEC